jgi:glc operon protein GlcG
MRSSTYQTPKFLLPFFGLLLCLTTHAAEPDLIRTDAVSLKLDGATVAINGAREHAKKMGLNVNITVVDSGGHLLAFARMDGARPASTYTSISKATTAALKLGDTGPLGSADEPPNVHLNLAVENAAAMSGGKFTTLLGGIAIIVDGQVIGGIGVGGATGSEDAEIARAGLAALHQALMSESEHKE